MSIQETVDAFKSDFELLGEPEAIMEYIFDMGKQHKGLPEEERTEESYVDGCASEAWLVCDYDDGIIKFRGHGTSEMAKGMMELLLKIFSDRTPDEILSFNPEELHKMGIVELLSPVRQQSLEAFLKKVYGYAQKCKEQDG